MAPRSRRVAPAAEALPPSEAALYLPDGDVVVIDGRRFRIGKMRIGASLRFTDWVVKFMGRGAAFKATLDSFADPSAKAAAVNTMSVLSLLPEDDVAELVAIALSSDEQIDRAWVTEHWDLDWVLPLLAQFTEVNPLGKYMGAVGKVTANLTAQFTSLTPTNGTTRSP
jgi:hypothetical protein